MLLEPANQLVAERRGRGQLLNDRVLPKPGTGPSPEAQVAGFFDLRFFGETADGESIECKVTGDADPGYGSTAKMLSEAALALVETGGDGHR